MFLSGLDEQEYYFPATGMYKVKIRKLLCSDHSSPKKSVCVLYNVSERQSLSPVYLVSFELRYDFVNKNIPLGTEG